MVWEFTEYPQDVDDMYWDNYEQTMMVTQDYKDLYLNQKQLQTDISKCNTIRSSCNNNIELVQSIGNVTRQSLHESDQLTSACKHFYASWLRRSESLRGRWQREPAPLSSLDHKIQHLRNEIAGLAVQDTQLFQQLFALQDSIDALKEQFEAENVYSNWSSGSSPCSLSPASSCTQLNSLRPGSDSGCEPTSLTSAPDCSTLKKCYSSMTPTSNVAKPKRRTTLVSHTSFVRQRVSYPPSARNRCRRSQTLLEPHAIPPESRSRPPRRPHSAASMHGGSNSLDSGIHTSDHEIFV